MMFGETFMENTPGYFIRPLCLYETGLLKDFLYEAIFVPDGVEPPPKEVINLPELRLYIEDFGRPDDYMPSACI